MKMRVNNLGNKSHDHYWIEEERFTTSGETPNKVWVKVKQSICSICRKTSQK